MDLKKALEKLLNLEVSLQKPSFTDDPAVMSRIMGRMSVYATTIEAELAKYEQDYELKQSVLYKKLLLGEKLSATAAEKHLKIELGELRGQIAYLTRIVSSAWKQIGTLQSRINHIVKFSETTNL